MFIPALKFFLINLKVVVVAVLCLRWRVWGFEVYLWSIRVGVEFFHQVHAVFGIDGPVDDGVFQAHPPQVHSYDAEHAGPLGDDHATHDQRRRNHVGYRPNTIFLNRERNP